MDPSSPLLCALDPHGRLQDLRGPWRQVLGRGPAELAGRRLAELVHPDDRAAFAAACRRTRRQAVVVHGRCTRPGGEAVGLEWTLFRLPGASQLHCLGRAGSTPGGGGRAPDGPFPGADPALVLQQQQALHLHTRLERIPDAFLSMDREWRLTYINREGERLLNLHHAEGLGHNMWALFPEEAGGIYRQKYEEALETGQTVRFEAYFSRENRWLELSVYPSAGGVSIFFADITRRVASDRQLKLLALVAQGTDNGVLILDAQGRTEWVNEAFTKHTGYTLAEMRGRVPRYVLSGPGTDPQTMDTIRAKYQEPEPFSVTVLIYPKAGEPLWVLLNITPLHNPAGELTQFICIQQNVQAQKAMEAQQARLTQDLYAHNRDLQQFTYILSHNLRAPLANALGLTKLLPRLASQPAMFDNSLGYLRQSLEQLDAVLQDLNRMLASRDQQHLQQLETVVLAEVCHQALQRVAPALDQCHGQVTLDVAEGLAVRGARAYVYSIFDNLLSNAIKYRAAERHLRIAIRCAADEHGMALISFADNGSGFDQHKKGAAVFQLYQRFHTAQPGRGVGLFLVRTHVEAMGGTVEVSSQVGVGTHFAIQLPQPG